jgi:hypothetical protein
METAGELTSDAVWNGDVLLEGDVVVPEGRTLRLRAGTTLSFAAKPRWSCAVFRGSPEGYPIESSSRELCDLVVFGRLEVEGTEDRPVAMGRGDERWGGVTVLGRGTARLRQARVRGASGGEDALLQCFDDGRLEMRGCVLSGARVGALAWGLSSVRAEDCLVEDAGCAFFGREGSTVDLGRVRCRRVEQGVWGQNWALLSAEDCRFEECSDFGAGAYDRSRLSVARGFFGRCRRGLFSAGDASADAVAAEFRGNQIGAQSTEDSLMSLKDCAFAGNEERDASFVHGSRAAVDGCRFAGARAAAIFVEHQERVSLAACAFGPAESAGGVGRA